MRDCPNCSQQIQDEAVYCRHCHTELEPPLWLTSMRKCPYCAEWIENDLERCRYCDRPLFTAGAQHAAPFVETSSTPEDFSQSLRQNLLDDESDEAAAIAAAAAEFVSDEPSVPLAGFDTGELRESALDDSRSAEFESSIYNEPQSDLRRSLYEEDEVAEEPSIGSEPQADLRSSLYDEDEVAEEPSTYYETGDSGTEFVEPPTPMESATDSSIWMAGADEPEETGPLVGETDDLGRSIAGTAGVSDLREDASAPPGQLRRTAGKVARAVIIIAVLGAVTWGLFTLAQGPAGAFIAEALATDIPTETPIPQPTATLRPAPTLPPVTEDPADDPAILLTEIGATTSEPECVSWDAISLEDEGAEFCAYGVIKRWWAGEEIPFIAIFSEDVGTFAIIDRTTKYPVGPGNCIMARGTVEIMGGTRPNIDAQGGLEECPEGFVEG